MVLQAQTDFVDSDPYAAFVRTDDLSPNFHFEAASMLIIGDRVALALESLLKKVPWKVQISNSNNIIVPGEKSNNNNDEEEVVRMLNTVQQQEEKEPNTMNNNNNNEDEVTTPTTTTASQTFVTTSVPRSRPS
eukprot:CAMPEP_0194161810 /NCGR_PEP_ID=MMETSP0152-20130528/79150_1 /TAXON_ID=1049557 /ORGANISM="Thalassiothrix antarctica, Strain L6-D1" /LENGTH=132 /DNA_ID=CAMNT_0038871641 /DNA_START=438 /DNA_END=833 /DNA_ORIENTATION=-